MKRKILLVILPVILFILYLGLSSSSTGITGVSSSGCTCHNATASGNTLVTITGLPAGGYTNSTVYPITITVTNNVITPSAGGFGLRDGFDLSSTAGSFTAIAGTTLNGSTEIRHNTPKAVVAGSASWTFNWTAPATGNSNVTFNVAGNATNGSGDNLGDQWNTASVTIIKSGTPLTVTATNTTIACNGSLSTITANGVGGTPSYQYKVNAGAYQNSNTFSGILAGIYTVTIKDALNNTATTSLNIVQPNVITVSLSSTTIACNGNTSTLTTTASGGTGTLNYRLNTGAYQLSNTFNNLVAGNYTVTVRDANLCTKTATRSIGQPAVLNLTTPTIGPVSCNNGTNGTITISTTGGSGVKTFTINPLGPQSNTLGQFTGLSPNTYTVTVTDGQGCTKTSSITLTNPAAVTVTAQDVVACSGNAMNLIGSPAGGVFSLPNPYTGPSSKYIYTYTTGTGCVISSDSAYAESKSVVLEAITSSNLTICTGGSIAMQVALKDQNCFCDNLYNGNTLEHINYVSFAGINRSSTSDSIGYHDYTSDTADVVPGNTYPITLGDGAFYGGDHWGVWIDYNQDGVFSDFKEFYYFPAGGSTTIGSIKIPNSVSNGVVRMRVRLIWITPMLPCGNTTWGETEDYTVRITGSSNPPAGITYLWSNNLNSTFTTPTAPYTIAQNIQAFENYSVLVSTPEGCSATANKSVAVTAGFLLDSVKATPSQVCPGGNSLLHAFPNVPANQDCIPSVANMNCTSLEYINNVSFGSIQNPTSCDLIGYKDYSNLSTNVTAGSSYSFSLSNGKFYLGDTWSIFIDFNHNGILDDIGEAFQFLPHSAVMNGSLTIPSTAFNGPTKMRIRLAGTLPCGMSGWGEVEDYTVNISGGVAAQPKIHYVWSNNLNSNLLAGNTALAIASNITTNENYHVLATNLVGCSQEVVVPVIVNCGYNLSLKLFIQGYYDQSTHLMQPVLLNQGVGSSGTVTDTVLVELRDASSTSTILSSQYSLLQTDGTLLCNFSSAPTQAFYVMVKHRNGLETWSQQAITASNTQYDFSTAASQAYGSNEIELESGVFGFYSGDVNQDGAIDAFDYLLIDPDIVAGNNGYLSTDINGDGAVDAFDYLIMDPNIVSGQAVAAP